MSTGITLGPKAAGATIVSELAEHPGGHLQYIAADCGGQQWIFAQPIGGARLALIDPGPPGCP